jgi:hypothetical protein
MSAGRPSSYTTELAEGICLRIADGESLADIVKDADMPGYATVTQWRREKPEFAAMYAQARADQADGEVDEMRALADAEPEMIRGELGGTRIDPAWVAMQKNRIDVRKWRASKFRPKVYGEKLEVDATVSVGDAIIDRLTRARGDGKK